MNQQDNSFFFYDNGLASQVDKIYQNENKKTKKNPNNPLMLTLIHVHVMCIICCL